MVSNEKPLAKVLRWILLTIINKKMLANVQNSSRH
jgi:hypothetical protein